MKNPGLTEIIKMRVKLWKVTFLLSHLFLIPLAVIGIDTVYNYHRAMQTVSSNSPMLVPFFLGVVLCLFNLGLTLGEVDED